VVSRALCVPGDSLMLWRFAGNQRTPFATPRVTAHPTGL
jgi:hypothetical protein